MTTYDQFLEARELAEALLTKHNLEVNRHDMNVQDRRIDRTFSKLASQLGFRIERIDALQHSTMDARTQGLRHG